MVNYKQLNKESRRIENEMSDVYSAFQDKYSENVRNENGDLVALCPVCNSQLLVDDDWAECKQCDARMFIKQITDLSSDYFLANHNHPDIDEAVVVGYPITEDQRKNIMPPAIFSIALYNEYIRPRMVEKLANGER